MKRFFSALLMTTFIIAGCSTERPVSKISDPKPTSLHKSVFINDVRLEIATNKEVFPADEIVPVRISVTNTGAKSARLTFPTAQKQDFAVADKSGGEVWRWSAGQMFAQVITKMDVEPGETYNYFGRVDVGTLAPGRYKISGWLLAQELLEEKITLEITVK